MELFSEVYGSYYKALRHVLEAFKNQNELKRDEITKIIDDTAFLDSAFFILPLLESGEWNLLKNNSNIFTTKFESNCFKLPLSYLEKSWLKSLLNDVRINLFFSESEKKDLDKLFGDVLDLFEIKDFHFFDKALDGDPYEDILYINNFRAILLAIRNKSVIKISYVSKNGSSSFRHFYPIKLEYSIKDDKFRLICYHLKSTVYVLTTLNLSRIENVLQSELIYISNFYHSKIPSKQFVVLQIFDERNALQRCMIQFATYEKETEYDEINKTYTCKIFYNADDETELVIRVLSFGPMIKVLGPDRFFNEIKLRIKKQIELIQPFN